MSSVPRRRNTILLTEVVDETPPPPVFSIAQNVRRNRFIAAGILTLVLILSFSLGRNDAESTSPAPAPDSAMAKLSAENERLRTRIAEIESEIAALNPSQSPAPQSDNAPITARVYVPDGSEKDDPFFGPKESDVIAMVFSDFQCRLCRDFHLRTVPKLRHDYADKNALKLIFRDFPLQGNEHARRAAAFAHCAGEQGAYWNAFDLLNANEKAMTSGDFSLLLPKLQMVDTANLAQCLRSKRYETEIDRDQAQGQELGAKGAPSMFVGARNKAGAFEGVFIRGAQPYPVIKQEIERVLHRAGR